MTYYSTMSCCISPPNFSDKVYIGIYNWAMDGNFNDLKESLYIYESDKAKFRIM
jgi:hypothetical protein